MNILNICLSDIPEESINQARNGKEYVNLVLSERKDEGRYGETHSISLTQSKDERQNKERKVYVGSGKQYQQHKKTEQPPQPTPNLKDEPKDELPF